MVKEKKIALSDAEKSTLILLWEGEDVLYVLDHSDYHDNNKAARCPKTCGGGDECGESIYESPASQGGYEVLENHLFKGKTQGDRFAHIGNGDEGFI